jgi:hypothetical protein
LAPDAAQFLLLLHGILHALYSMMAQSSVGVKENMDNLAMEPTLAKLHHHPATQLASVLAELQR